MKRTQKSGHLIEFEHFFLTINRHFDSLVHRRFTFFPFKCDYEKEKMK